MELHVIYTFYISKECTFLNKMFKNRGSSTRKCFSIRIVSDCQGQGRTFPKFTAAHGAHTFLPKQQQKSFLAVKAVRAWCLLISLPSSPRCLESINVYSQATSIPVLTQNKRHIFSHFWLRWIQFFIKKQSEYFYYIKQDRRRTYNVTLRRVSATIVVVEKK